MAEQDLDRSESATPYKLEKARERGSVPRSVDVNSFAVLAVAAIACFAWLGGAAQCLAEASRRLWRLAGTDLSQPAAAAHLLSIMLLAGLKLIAPLLVAIAIAALLSNLVQSGGPLLSFEPIKPDFNRLNPAQGFKKLFSLRVVYEAGKSVFKLVVLAGVCAAVLRALLPGLVALGGTQDKAYLPLLIDFTGRLLVKLLGVLLILALVDWVYVRYEYAKQMRMSRREIKDEYKQREGDPRIRARIRELRLQLLKRSQALRELPKADVLVTNPTRVAVALSYHHGASPAPRVLAKGAGGLARKMRDAAFSHRVPIVQSPVLARALYRQVEAGGYVPEEWYPQVARILVWVLAARRARAGNAQEAAA